MQTEQDKQAAVIAVRDQTTVTEMVELLCAAYVAVHPGCELENRIANLLREIGRLQA